MRLDLLVGLQLFLTISILSSVQGKNKKFTRNKRHLPLIFQNPAAITFITGFGIPVNDLNPELVTVGMVFKAQQFLPTTNEALRHQASHSIHKREEIEEETKTQTFDIGRIKFYEALEQLSTSLGQNGKSCVLKMICEAAAMPFHYANGVLGEIMHIFLTPSSSLDISNASFIYLKAERMGRKPHIQCAELYKDCKISILERITRLLV